tara:strand:- start:2855 stop:4387 length:1533 start_codon:yes stop_codon:yes gene_type:complete
VNVSNKSLPKFTNSIFKFLSLGLFVFYIINNVKNNIYEVLFIDERMLIDDIYNVWLVEDLYDRFTSISNQSLKNILIIFIELAYGGDLRYGRLWSNFFTILAGPITFISDTAVIIFARILNSLLFFSGAYFLSKYLVEKKYLWISVFTIYSFSAVEFIHRVPKPDPMVILFIAIGLKYFLDKKFYLSIFFLALASFLKINAIIIFFFIWINIFIKSNENKIRLIIKTSLISLGSLFIVNPILLIPPLNLGGIEIPNFYKIYFNWLTTQGSNSDEVLFNFTFFNNWLYELSNFYKFPNKYLFLFIVTVLLVFLAKEILISSNDLSKYLLLIFCFYMFFYFFFIERAWTHYLHLPCSLLLIAYFRVLKDKHLTLIPIILISIFAVIGNFSNIDRFLNDKTFNMNDRLDYVSVETQDDAEVLVARVVDKIKLIYEENEHLNKNKVYWHPDLITPRNKVTYNANFYVREYWGNKEKVNFAIEEGDIFVTYTNYETSDLIMKTNIENFYIYYYKK